MPSKFNTAIAKHNSSLKAFAGEEITLHRGEVSSTVTMWSSNTLIQSVTSGDSITDIPVKEWCCRAQDYVLNGNVELPLVGDVIIEGSDYYQVLPPAGKSCYESAGPGALKIYSKRVA